MGIFTRDRTPAVRIEPRLAPMERRDIEAPASEPGFFGLAPMSGTSAFVSVAMAENLSTVCACINALASGLAALPARVYQTQGNGRVETPGHPVARIIRAPNPYMTWADWVEWTVAQMLLHGNALSVVVRDGAGRPVALNPIPWNTVSVSVLPSGRLAFDVVTSGDGLASSRTAAVSRRYLDTDVFFLKDRMDGPYIGRSRISRAPATIDGALELQTYTGSVWSNAATPSVAVTLPATITPAGFRRMEAELNDRSVGARRAKSVMYLDKDTTVTPLSVSPEDAEVLASRKFSVTELCRLFNVPPPIIQDYANNTFTNAETASKWFATNSLAPLARKIESEMSRSVFTDPAFHMEIDLSGLLRGDFASRWAANVAAVTAGILTKDEVREQEGWGPLPNNVTISE